MGQTYIWANLNRNEETRLGQIQAAQQVKRVLLTLRPRAHFTDIPMRARQGKGPHI